MCTEIKRTAMSLMMAFYFAAGVLHLVSGQFPVRPIFNENSYTGSEGSTIVGHLVISGLSGESSIRSGSLVYEIEALKLYGLATYDSDYAFQSGRNITKVTFSANRDASSSFIINLHKDDLHEGDEIFFLKFRFASATGDFNSAFQYQDSTTNFQQECIITDDDVVVCEMDPLPIDVSCENDRYCQVVNENSVTSVAITSHCNGRFERSIIVEVNCQGASTSEVRAATVSQDFVFSSFSFEYPPSVSNISRATQKLVVPIINDDVAEPLIEQFVCDLLLGPGAIISTENQRITVNIKDDDIIKLSWRHQSFTFFENKMAEVELNASDPFPGVRAIATMARQIDSVFTANHPSLSKFTSIGIGRATVIFSGVKYEVATEGLDFEVDQVSFIFNISDSSMGYFEIIQDGICEQDEIFAAILTGEVGSFDVTVVEPNTTFIIIKDVDVARVGFMETETVVERGKLVTFTLSTSALSSQDILADIRCSPINSAVADQSNEIYATARIFRGSRNSQSVSFNIGDVLPEDSDCLLCNVTRIDGPPCAQVGRNLMKVCILKTGCSFGKLLESGDSLENFTSIQSNKFIASLMPTSESLSTFKPFAFLCYKVFPVTQKPVNLFSSSCLSINAQFVFSTGQFYISSIGIVISGLYGQCTHVTVVGNNKDEECQVTVNGVLIPSSNSSYSTGSFVIEGSTVSPKVNLVTVLSRLDDSAHAIAKIMCTWNPLPEMTVLRLYIPNFLSISSSHGLLGQLWNAQATVISPECEDFVLFSSLPFYKVLLPDGHTIPVIHRTRQWDRDGSCLHASFQGPSVIEGTPKDYTVSNLLATEYKYSNFSNRCVQMKQSHMN